MDRIALIFASGYGLIGVILGAFGAHALAGRLAPDMQRVWATAVEYQFYHALALLALAVLLRNGLAGAWSAAAVYCFAGGVLVFSGSLYVLALSGVRWLGAITPLGGLLLIAGWVCLIVAVLRET